jgi:hypothetical protein
LLGGNGKTLPKIGKEKLLENVQSLN